MKKLVKILSGKFSSKCLELIGVSDTFRCNLKPLSLEETKLSKSKYVVVRVKINNHYYYLWYNRSNIDLFNNNNNNKLDVPITDSKDFLIIVKGNTIYSDSSEGILNMVKSQLNMCAPKTKVAIYRIVKFVELETVLKITYPKW